MAQLSESRRGEGGALLTVDEAALRAASLVTPIEQEQRLSLAGADGRVLARDLVAPVDLPLFANSAVDGYAVRFADLATTGEAKLPLAGRVAAGETAAGVASQGVAVRIFTGAPMPPGADTVFMQEDVAVADGYVRLPPGLARGANMRPAGEDVGRGTRVLPAGHRLRPQDLALLAALGLAKVDVLRRPRVAVFSTGDELVEPGRSLTGAGIYDSNRFMLCAMLARAGAEPVDLGILPDDREVLVRHLSQAAAGADLVLTSGGVSVGEEDHVKAAVELCGALDFWRIAIRPGRPVAMGRVGSTPFVGLPGNPVASFVTFALVARALVARLAGAHGEPPVRVAARLAFSGRKRQGRREYWRVSLAAGPDGVPVAHRHPGEGAGSLASLCQSDGLAELPEEMTEFSQGALIPVLPFATLLG